MTQKYTKLFLKMKNLSLLLKEITQPMSTLKKQLLTHQQIEEICDEIPINKAIPEVIATSMRNNILMRLENDLKNVQIYPKLFTKFKEAVIKEYYKTLIAPGEAVGILMAMSIGERTTQTILSSFHSCGLSIKTVVTGVPRFTELLNATKNPKMTNCLIFLNQQFKDITDIRNAVGNSMTEVTLKRVTLSTELIKEPPTESWQHLFCDLYDINIEELDWHIRFHLDIDLLYEYHITVKMISEAIKKEYGDAIILYKPDWLGVIDVFVEGLAGLNDDTKEEKMSISSDEQKEDEIDIEDEINDLSDTEIVEDEQENFEPTTTIMPETISLETKFSVPKIIEQKDEIIPKDIEKIIQMEDKILPALLGVKISGMNGIKDIFFEKRKISLTNSEEEWVITTEGSNLAELYTHPLVDKQKTLCNDMWEIYTIFGIEAARQFLIEEYMDVLSSDGSFINVSNVEILVNIMTFYGTLISISRYGQKKLSTGPLAMASFEQSLDNFLNSAINGEKENTNGVSASIMLGKMPKVGTGLFDLSIDINALINKQLQDKTTVKEVVKETILSPINNTEENFTKKTFFSF